MPIAIERGVVCNLWENWGRLGCGSKLEEEGGG